MTLVLATLIGLLFAFGTYLLLRRDLVWVIWGLAIVSQAANAYLLTVAGIAVPGPESVPVLGHVGEGAVPETADPLVQALVLTAIVISFGMTAFALVVTYRVYEEHDTIDVHEIGGEH